MGELGKVGTGAAQGARAVTAVAAHRAAPGRPSLVPALRPGPTSLCRCAEVPPRVPVPGLRGGGCAVAGSCIFKTQMEGFHRWAVRPGSAMTVMKSRSHTQVCGDVPSTLSGVTLDTTAGLSHHGDSCQAQGCLGLGTCPRAREQGPSSVSAAVLFLLLSVPKFVFSLCLCTPSLPPLLSTCPLTISQEFKVKKEIVI